eukprot:GILI01010593.1.p1 GENE.GILI01010593.1~~GILI01010593.1.p1  ORF type:complete len:413 (+),score=53.99 GILI01010593.1:35-1240(+)
MPFTRLTKPKPHVPHTPIAKACVFGSGAFGTALSTAIARTPNKPTVNVWHMDAEEAAMVNKKHENVFFLNGCPLPHNVVFTADVEQALQGAEIIAIAVPTQFLRGFLTKNLPALTKFFSSNPSTPVIVGSKGIEESSLLFPSEIVADVLKGAINPKNLAALSGPNFAKEIATNRFSAATVASDDIHTARKIQGIISYPSADCTYKLYASTDVIGCEVASAVKNVVAIAAGTVQGFGEQLNCRAALICRGMAELTALVDKMGGKGYSLQGLAGVGDMLLTCSSEGSRNFSVGMRIGKGEPISKIMANPRAVAEGVATARALKALSSKLGQKMPICDAVHAVIYEGKDAKELFQKILAAPLDDEIHHLGLSPTTTMGNELRQRVAKVLKIREDYAKEAKKSKL